MQFYEKMILNILTQWSEFHFLNAHHLSLQTCNYEKSFTHTSSGYVLLTVLAKYMQANQMFTRGEEELSVQKRNL